MLRIVIPAAPIVLLLAVWAHGAETYVLLQNGNVLRGEVRAEAGRLKVRSNGSEAWLETSQVAAQFDTLEAAYDWQRRQLASPMAADHLRLASWCLKQRLLPQASREILDARTLSPKNTRVQAMERRLMELAFPKPKTAPVQPLQHKKPPAMTDAQVSRLPPGALEQFTRRIQPVLVNNCTSSCHQVDGPRPFQLNRNLLHGASDQRSTRMNLAAVLKQIDQHAPDNSPLLKAVLASHAGRKGPAFVGRRAALNDSLKNWVNLIAAGQPSRVANSKLPGRRSSAGVFSQFKEQQERDRMLDGPARPAARRDEFDPEIFNRMSRSP